MKESTLLNPRDFADKNFNINEVLEVSSNSNSIPEFDYLGHKFVYDTYNQNPDLVQENRHGYKVFFTRDARYISQYYGLRDEIYRFENGWQEFDGSEKEFDRVGRLMVVTRGEKVIGGARLMFSDECKYFSNEYPGTIFQYMKILERYESKGWADEGVNPKNVVISEISAVVSSKDGRNSDIVESMFVLSSEAALARSCYYIFGVAEFTLCRFYRITWGKMGYELEIVITNPWDKKKVYNYMKMFPIYVKLKSKKNAKKS